MRSWGNTKLGDLSEKKSFKVTTGTGDGRGTQGTLTSDIRARARKRPLGEKAAR